MILKNFRIAYKVCRYSRYSRTGVYRKVEPHSVSKLHKGVKYTLDKLAKPPMGENPFLFVFETEDAARKFAGRFRIIFKGIAFNYSKRALEIDGTRIFAREFPKGTLFCDAFLPIVVIKTGF